MTTRFFNPSQYLSLVFIVIVSSCTKSTLEPILVNIPIADTIPSVTICSKKWMTKNLNVVTFRNGDTIPEITNANEWNDMFVQAPKPAWCHYGNDATTDSLYGKYYNWAAINDPRGLAPEGWHVATYEDWANLVDSCLGGRDIAGRVMKEAGNANWDNPHMPIYEPTNSSGLTCLPGGYRAGYSFDNSLGFSGNWWCGTSDSTAQPKMIWLYHASNEVMFQTIWTNWAISVRCVKD